MREKKKKKKDGKKTVEFVDDSNLSSKTNPQMRSTAPRPLYI